MHARTNTVVAQQPELINGSKQLHDCVYRPLGILVGAWPDSLFLQEWRGVPTVLGEVELDQSCEVGHARGHAKEVILADGQPPQVGEVEEFLGRRVEVNAHAQCSKEYK